MKCSRHDLEAIGVCAYCGRALCKQCVPATGTARLTCAEECAAALTRHDRALEVLLEKSLQSAKANSVYYFLCGILCVGATIAAYFWLPVPFLMWFLGTTAVALLISAAWFGRVARKMKS
ncbi:MAG TPA: hypothetical protein VGO67_01405 [Verrucomicrobiae bacterium]|jgi:hypothetical protein